MPVDSCRPLINHRSTTTAILHRKAYQQHLCPKRMRSRSDFVMKLAAVQQFEFDGTSGHCMHNRTALVHWQCQLISYFHSGMSCHYIILCIKHVFAHVHNGGHRGGLAIHASAMRMADHEDRIIADIIHGASPHLVVCTCPDHDLITNAFANGCFRKPLTAVTTRHVTRPSQFGGFPIGNAYASTC